MPQIVDSYSESNQDALGSLDSDATHFQGIGQSFVGNGGVLYSAKFYLDKAGSPTGNAVAKIYALRNTPGVNSSPDGSALATSNVFDVSTLTGTLQLIELLFTGAEKITLTNATNYFVTIEYSGGDSSNRVRVGLDIISPADAGANWATLQSGTWTGASTADICFYVYSDDPPTTSTSTTTSTTTTSTSTSSTSTSTTSTSSSTSTTTSTSTTVSITTSTSTTSTSSSTSTTTSTSSSTSTTSTSSSTSTTTSTSSSTSTTSTSSSTSTSTTSTSSSTSTTSTSSSTSTSTTSTSTSTSTSTTSTSSSTSTTTTSTSTSSSTSTSTSSSTTTSTTTTWPYLFSVDDDDDHFAVEKESEPTLDFTVDRKTD